MRWVCVWGGWFLHPPNASACRPAPLLAPGPCQGGLQEEEVLTNYRSLRAGCCRAGPIPGHARAPNPDTLSPSTTAQGIFGKPGGHLQIGVAHHRFHRF